RVVLPLRPDPRGSGRATGLASRHIEATTGGGPQRPASPVREAASKALAGLDEQATPSLEGTLKSTDSVEVRVRVARILEQRRGAAITADRLRQIRAAMVLEQIGGGEAKDLLRRWAGGPVGARLTTEAAAALRRLEAVSKVNR